MLKIIMPVGIPGSGKSTWAKNEISKDPDNWCRINNDDIRAMMNNSVWSKDYENLITETRNTILREALKRGKNVIIDNLNINKRHFDDVVKVAKTVNSDFEIVEKPFYIDVDEAIARDSLREGKAKVGEKVIRKWFKESGGLQFASYVPRKEILHSVKSVKVKKVAWVDGLEQVAIFDLDGTMCEISHRSPYDASKCHLDGKNEHVVSLCKLFHEQGIKIMFFSGREDKYKEQTENWLNQHFGGTYELHMRKESDFRKDSLIKEELYRAYVENKYNVIAVVDDRLQVCELWHQLGLPLFRVGDPKASF